MYALMSDFKMLWLCCHVSLVPSLVPSPTSSFSSLVTILQATKSWAWDWVRGYLVPRLEPETTGHVNKAKLQQSLLMDVDLPLGTEQALMPHSVYIIPCILL